MMNRILVKYATRSRPEMFRQRVKELNESIDGEITMLVSLDNDDTESIKVACDFGDNIFFTVNAPAGKVNAINSDVDKYEWDILLVMSDDMIPQVNGWDTIIKNDVAQHFGESTDFFLHYNDGYVGDRLCTMTIIGRDYYNRDGFVYNPIYRSICCDSEAMHVAQMRGKYRYFDQVLFKHHHPANTTGAFVDQLYRQNEVFEGNDIQVYFNRLAIYFGLRIEEIVEPCPINPAIYRDRVTENLDGLRPKLAILIPTIEGREESCERLVNSIVDQKKQLGFNGEVCIWVLKDAQEKTIGEKRNELEFMAIRSGCTHRAFIDDDDIVSPDYLALNMPGVYMMYDCNTLVGRYFENGRYDRPFIHSLKYDHWWQDEKAYYRNPNHLNVVRLDRIKDIRFPEQSFGEDGKWSEAIQAAGVLRNQYEIEMPFYDYLCVSKSQEYVDKINKQRK